MKLASRILGAMVIVMLIVTTVLIFIVANTIVKDAAASIGSGNGDAVDLIAGTIAAATAMLGYAGYILINAVGAAMILYLILFVVSYIKLYYVKSQVEFIRYSAIIGGIILFFELIIFVCDPAEGWKAFTVITLTSVLMAAYAAVSAKYLKNATEYEDAPTRKEKPSSRKEKPSSRNVKPAVPYAEPPVIKTGYITVEEYDDEEDNDVY